MMDCPVCHHETRACEILAYRTCEDCAMGVWEERGVETNHPLTDSEEAKRVTMPGVHKTYGDGIPLPREQRTSGIRRLSVSLKRINGRRLSGIKEGSHNR